MSPKTCLPMLLAALFTSGCLSSTYTIPEAEMKRLAKRSDIERVEAAHRVRVVQDTSFASKPGRHSYHCDDPGHPHVRLNLHHHHGHVHGHWHPRYRAGGHFGRLPRGARPVIHGTRGGRPVIHAPRGGRPVVHAPRGGGRPVVHAPRGGGRASGGRSSGGSGGGSSGGGGGFDIKSGEAIAVAVVVAAVGVTVGLIATEGMRYDGWVELGPRHPVHLVDRRGRSRTVHLDAIRPEHLKGGVRAVVRRGEGQGGRADLLGRAPLDRKGFAWRMEMGSLQMQMPDGSMPDIFASTMQLGYFPTQWLGINGTLTLGWGDHDGNDLLAARYGIEVQAMPIDLGPFHLGAFGMGGFAYDARDNGALVPGEKTAPTFGTGLLAELELTTRLAISARFGAQWRQWDDAGLSDTAYMGSVGFAIY